VNDLVKLAINAHGGMQRWEQISRLRAAALITGAIWAAHLIRLRPAVDWLARSVCTFWLCDWPGTSPRGASGRGALAWNDDSCAAARSSWLRMETLPDWSDQWTKQYAATSTPSPPGIALCSTGSTT
jgi:hypothetical protein